MIAERIHHIRRTNQAEYDKLLLYCAFREWASRRSRHRLMHYKLQVLNVNSTVKICHGCMKDETSLLIARQSGALPYLTGFSSLVKHHISLLEELKEKDLFMVTETTDLLRSLDAEYKQITRLQPFKCDQIPEVCEDAIFTLSKKKVLYTAVRDRCDMETRMCLEKIRRDFNRMARVYVRFSFIYRYISPHPPIQLRELYQLLREHELEMESWRQYRASHPQSTQPPPPPPHYLREYQPPT